MAHLLDELWGHSHADESLHLSLVIDDPESAEMRVHQGAGSFGQVEENLVDVQFPGHELAGLEQVEQSMVSGQKVIAPRHLRPARRVRVGRIEVTEV